MSQPQFVLPHNQLNVSQSPANELPINEILVNERPINSPSIDEALINAGSINLNKVKYVHNLGASPVDVNAGHLAAESTTSDPPLPTVFNMLLIFSSLWIGLLSALITCCLSQATRLEIIVMLTGQMLAGLIMGALFSRINGERRSAEWRWRLALVNAGLPWGIFLVGASWAAALFYLLGTNVPAAILVWGPILILKQYFWLPLGLLPLMLVSARAQILHYGDPSLRLVTPLATTPPTPTERTFAVRRRWQSNGRCDICHQDDRFDPKISFCRRCQRYSL